jgi:hypothetical protein
MNKPTWLLEYKRDVFSQTGEDGIIEKILGVLPDHDSWCVEFGAWDGLLFSNTRHLICAKGYSAVLIEAAEQRFLALQRSYAAYQNRIIALNRYVGFSDDDNLDVILGETPVPLDFDLLSIDIDGNDYHVWKRLFRYQPKMVVIEFNHTIPTEVRFIQPANPNINQGSSLLAMVELAKDKGYELVCVLRYNAFFVRKEYFHLFGMESNEPHILRTDTSRITFLFSGYDGTVFLHGYGRLPWHGLDLKAAAVQLLPSYLRRYPERYSCSQKLVCHLYLLLNQPKRFMANVRKKLGVVRKGRARTEEIK